MIHTSFAVTFVMVVLSSLTAAPLPIPSGEATAAPSAAPAPAAAAAAACDPLPVPSNVPPPSDGLYSGPLFETHLHDSAGKSAEELCRYLEEEQTHWVVLFNSLLRPDTPAPDVTRSLQFTTTLQPRVVSLLGPGRALFGPDATLTQEFLDRYLVPRGPFQGVGEIPLWMPELAQVTYTGPLFQAFLRVVNKIGGVVMIHPRVVPPSQRNQEQADLEAMVRAYPAIIFLFHTGPSQTGPSEPELFDQSIAPLISRYPNVYFTFDLNHILTGPWGVLIGGRERIISPEEFARSVNEVGVDRIIQYNLDRSRSWFEKYPNRILWGTDRGQAWMFEEPSRRALIQVTRRFIARLPAQVQEAYAFRNAVRAFGRYLVPPVLANAIYFAQVADGGGFSTIFTIPNTTSLTLAGVLKFFNPNGTPRTISLNGSLNSQFSVTLPAGGSARLQSDNIGPALTGWASFQSSEAVQGIATFDLRNNQGHLVTTAAVLGSRGTRRVVIPVEVNSTTNTGIAVAQVGATRPAVVRLRLAGENGAELASVLDRRFNPLGPLQHVADFVTAFFPGVQSISNFRGTLIVEVIGEGEIAVTGLVLKEGLLSALPVVEPAQPSPAP